MRFSFLKQFILCFCVTGLLWSTAASAHDKPTVEVETLLRSGSSWDAVPYTAYPSGAPELSVLKITIPANTTLPWHTHPMPNAAYILSGELTVEKKETGAKKLLKPGQVLPEMVNEFHRGFTGDMPAVLIVFYAGSKDLPLSKK